MNHFRIRVALPFIPGIDSLNDSFTPQFYQKVDEQSDYFRSKLLLAINAEIVNNWSILLKPSPIPEYDYLVDIFVENQTDGERIINMIRYVEHEKHFHFKVEPFSKLFS